MISSGNWSLTQRRLYGPRVVRGQHVAFVAGAKPENIKYCNGESARNENERRSLSGGFVESLAPRVSGRQCKTMMT